jgi:hypothetical protein
MGQALALKLNRGNEFPGLRRARPTRLPSRLASMVATDISLSSHAETPLTALLQLGFEPATRSAHHVLYYSRRQIVAWTGASVAVTVLAAASAAVSYV